jgi:peptide/nickel transport system permease protein
VTGIMEGASGRIDQLVAEPGSPRRGRGRKRGALRIGVSLGIIGVYLVAAIVGPMLVQYDPVATDTMNRLLPPMALRVDGSLALFGTDQVGQDLFAQTLQGARMSMLVGVSALVIAGVVGVLVGVLSGYFGGAIDSALMRLADVQLAFPGILLAVLVASVLGQSVVNVIIILAIGGWVSYARVTRSQVLATKNREFVDATRTLGAGHWHTVRTTILPACVAPIMVIATMDIGSIILAEASLSFLGLGTPPSTPSWGLTIAGGRNYLASAWWISTIPGICLAVLVIAFGVLGDALRDRFDPRLKEV